MGAILPVNVEVPCKNTVFSQNKMGHKTGNTYIYNIYIHIYRFRKLQSLSHITLRLIETAKHRHWWIPAEIAGNFHHKNGSSSPRGLTQGNLGIWEPVFVNSSTDKKKHYGVAQSGEFWTDSIFGPSLWSFTPKKLLPIRWGPWNSSGNLRLLAFGNKTSIWLKTPGYLGVQLRLNKWVYLH